MYPSDDASSPAAPAPQILLVEDHAKTSALVSSKLGLEGYEVHAVRDGALGLTEGLKETWDVIVADIMLPRMNGLAMVRELRARGSTTPILLLSARGEVEQRVEGLDAGADDYLAKPFAMSELMARVRSLTRRGTPAKGGPLRLGNMVFDPRTREVRRDGRRLYLSLRECQLLDRLIRAEGAIVSRRELLQSVWEYNFDPDSNCVEVYVRRLRDKIDLPDEDSLIVTVRGLGYAVRSTP